MAGHGWHCVSKSEVKREMCDCGKGLIIHYEKEWESDWAGDKIEHSTEITCNDKACELIRRQRIEAHNKKAIDSINW